MSMVPSTTPLLFSLACISLRSARPAQAKAFRYTVKDINTVEDTGEQLGARSPREHRYIRQRVDALISLNRRTAVSTQRHHFFAQGTAT